MLVCAPKLACALACAPRLVCVPICALAGGPLQKEIKKKRKKGPWLMKLYTTPTSILTLVTWVQSRLPFEQTPHVGWPSGLQPLAITILQCTASLAAGGYDRPCGKIKSLFLLSRARCLIVSSEFSYATTLSYKYINIFFIYFFYGSTYKGL